MASRIPLILCGKTSAIAQGVAAGLKTEYEVIHLILNTEEGVANIPALLRGENPPRPDTSDVGTKNYAAPAAAVVTGGGYNDADVARMRAACDVRCKKVPWLRPDLAKPAPPLGPAYGPAMVERTRACLAALASEGKMSEDGVHYF